MLVCKKQIIYNIIGGFMTSNEALNLLYKDVINNNDDLLKEENRWVLHCYYVGVAAGRIAEKLGLDSDYAMALGFVHDIGRKISHPGHVPEGYKYLIEHGYEREARSTITHSFINNDINLVAGGGPNTPEKRNYMQSLLDKYNPCTIYDNIVQLCDLFCLHTGFTTIEHRILDVYKRKGIFDNSKAHFEATIKLKEDVEHKMGCNLYDLFPEIREDDISNIQNDYNEIENMLNVKKR